VSDFLQVDESTFRRLLPGSKKAMIRGYELRLPSLADLIAMKIFAFSQNTARRMGKDLPDIAFLAVINGLDVESAFGLSASVSAPLKSTSSFAARLRGCRIMTLRATLREPLPPRLTMDEYCVWVMDTVCRLSPAHIARQKALEKRIEVPFFFPEDSCPAAPGKSDSKRGAHCLIERRRRGPLKSFLAHHAVYPPSTTSVLPVTNDDASDARNTMAPFSSSIRP